MAQISRCPECGRKVSLPEAVDPCDLVGCPLCDGQFLLCEVTAQTESAPLLVSMTSSKLPEGESQQVASLVAAAEEIARNAANLEERAESFQLKAQELEPEEGLDVDSLLEEVDSLEDDTKTLRASAAEWPLKTDTPDVLDQAHKAKAQAVEGVIGSIRVVADKFDTRAAFLTTQADDILGAVSEDDEVDSEPNATPPEEVSEPVEEKKEEKEGETDVLDRSSEEKFIVEPPKDKDSDVAADGFSWLAQNEGDDSPKSAGTEADRFSFESEEQLEEPSEVKALRSEASDLKSKATDLRVRADALATEPVDDDSAGMFGGIGSETPGFSPGGAFDFASGEQASSTTPGTIARPRRQTKKKKSAFREVLGIALGGIGGVLIALYGLAIFGGEKRSMSVYLPGVKHTEKYRPEWWPNWATLGTANDTDVSEEGEVGEKNATETPATNSKDDRSASVKKPTESPPQQSVDFTDWPSYSADDLDRAIMATHLAFGCPKCRSNGTIRQKKKQAVCPECQGTPPNNLTPEAYRKFCRLAEVVAFGDDSIRAKKPAVRDLLLKLGAIDKNIIETGQMANQHLDDKDRDTSGMLLSGKVGEISQLGEFHAASVTMPGNGPTIQLASIEPLEIKENDRVLALGSLIDNPTGDASSEAMLVLIGTWVEKAEIDAANKIEK